MPRKKAVVVVEKPRVRPNYGNVVIRPIEPSATSPGGIVLPQTDERTKPFKGLIESLAYDTDFYDEHEWQKGQTVFFKPYAAHEIEVDGETLLIVADRDILAVLNEPAPVTE